MHVLNDEPSCSTAPVRSVFRLFPVCHIVLDTHDTRMPPGRPLMNAEAISTGNRVPSERFMMSGSSTRRSPALTRVSVRLPGHEPLQRRIRMRVSL